MSERERGGRYLSFCRGCGLWSGTGGASFGGLELESRGSIGEEI